MFDPRYGLVRQALGWVGSSRRLVHDRPWPLVMVIVVYLWKNLGYVALDLPGRPAGRARRSCATPPPSTARRRPARSVRSSCRCSRRRRSSSRSTTLLSSLQSFDIIQAMTKGGPLGSTTTLMYQIYEEGFVTGRAGYASAVATHPLPPAAGRHGRPAALRREEGALRMSVQNPVRDVPATAPRTTSGASRAEHPGSPVDAPPAPGGAGHRPSGARAPERRAVVGPCTWARTRPCWSRPSSWRCRSCGWCSRASSAPTELYSIPLQWLPRTSTSRTTSRRRRASPSGGCSSTAWA